MGKAMTAKQKLRSAIIVAAAGGGILLVCYNGMRKAKATADWAETEGVVISSEFKRTLWRGGKGHRRRNYHKFNINYRYSVDGTEYGSERFSFASSYLLEREKVAHFEENYQEGQTIKVYYNPDNASESVLIRGLPAFNRPGGRLLMGWLLFGIGAFATFTFGSKVLRERKRAGGLEMIKDE